LALAPVLACACSLLTNLGGLDGEAPPLDSGVDGTVPAATADARDDQPIPEAGGDDGGVPDAANTPSDGGAGCINLLINPGFEDAVTCAPWIGYIGTVATSSVSPRSGGHACRACGPTGFLTRAGVMQAFDAGEKVRFSAWVRAEDAQFTGQAVWASVNADGTPEIGSLMTLAQRYSQVSIVYDYPNSDAGKIVTSMAVTAPGVDAGCVLFDDVELCRVTPDGSPQ
jgi:hypothetical protein